MGEYVNRLEEENQGLREKMYEIREEKDILEEQLERAKQVRSSDNEIVDMKKVIENKNTTIKQYIEDINSLNNRVNILTQDITHKNISICDMRNDTDHMQAAIDSLEATCRQQSLDIEAYKSAVRQQEDDSRLHRDKQMILKEEIVRLTSEIEAYKGSVDDHRKDIGLYKQEVIDAHNTIEKYKKSVDELKTNINSMSVAAQGKESEVANMKSMVEEYRRKCDEIEKERKNDIHQYGLEIKKLMNLNMQQVEMMKQENKELDDKIMNEVRKRKEEEDKWKIKERSMQEEIDNISSSKKVVQKKKKQSSSTDHMIEYDNIITQKNHEIIDLTSTNNQLINRINHMESELHAQDRRFVICEDENKYLKEKNAQLTDRIKYFNTIESIQQKTELEIVKELNDLRENILILKEERDKILRHLNDNGIDTVKQLNNITSDSFLQYIQRLTMEKKSLGEELVEKEAVIGGLRNQLDNLEARFRIADEERTNVKDELKRLSSECERLRRRADEKEIEASKHLEILTHRENEFSADLQEKELLLKSNTTEKERLLSTISEMNRIIGKVEQNNSETVKMLNEINKFQKEKFFNALMEIKQAEGKKVDESCIEIITKLVDRTNMMAQKDAKLQMSEEKYKKLISKMSNLKKENKMIRQLEEETILKQIIGVVQNIKSNGGGNSKKITNNLADSICSKLKEALFAEEEKKGKSSVSSEIFQSELSATLVELRKKEAENEHLSERLLILEVQLEKAKEDLKYSERENKKLEKETKKTVKLFNEEIGMMVDKISKQEECQPTRSDIKDLNVALREKKE